MCFLFFRETRVDILLAAPKPKKKNMFIKSWQFYIKKIVKNFFKVILRI